MFIESGWSTLAWGAYFRSEILGEVKKCDKFLKRNWLRSKYKSDKFIFDDKSQVDKLPESWLSDNHKSDRFTFEVTSQSDKSP